MNTGFGPEAPSTGFAVTPHATRPPLRVVCLFRSRRGIFPHPRWRWGLVASLSPKGHTAKAASRWFERSPRRAGIPKCPGL